MKRLITLLTMLSILVLSIPAFAEIPHYIQFQGKTTDAEEKPLDGEYTMKFRIYDAKEDGNLIWEEAYDGDNKVLIEKGIFSVLLGGANPLNIPFDKSYWISMEIGTTDHSNELPRQPITSVGYAYRAEKAAVLDTQTQNLDIGGYRIINVINPTDNQDVATKKYVDDNFLHKQIFTTDGTFTAPAGVTKVYLTMVGAGGGGGSGGVGAPQHPGGGGGSGVCMIKAPYTVVPASEYIIQVGVKGAGGAPESAGGNGESTIFDTGGGALTVNAGSGGATGAGGSPGTGGAGGAATGTPSGATAGGVVSIAGITGANGTSGTVGGGGAGSRMGAGGAGGSGTAGANATYYGAGGGGGYKGNYAGGNGSDGIVIVEW